jgi:hypothetical protein
MRCDAHKKLCHNCDTKPVFTVKTDFIDDVRLLILRSLLKAKNWPTNPAYRLARYFQRFSSPRHFPALFSIPILWIAALVAARRRESY